MAALSTNTKATENSVVWKYDDGITPEVDYLVQRNKFKLHLDDFSIKSSKGWKSYPVTYRILFHSIEKNDNGDVTKLLYIVFESDEAKMDDIELKMDYLRKNYGFIVDPDSDDHYYSFKVNGKWYHYDKDTQFEFFNVQRDGEEISSLKFNVQLKGEKIWYENQGTETPEVIYLMKKKHLVVDSDNSEKMYSYLGKNGETVTYPSGSRIVFHNIKLNQNGEIVSLGFQFQKLVWR